MVSRISVKVACTDHTVWTVIYAQDVSRAAKPCWLCQKFREHAARSNNKFRPDVRSESRLPSLVGFHHSCPLDYHILLESSPIMVSTRRGVDL